MYFWTYGIWSIVLFSYGVSKDCMVYISIWIVKFDDGDKYRSMVNDYLHIKMIYIYMYIYVYIYICFIQPMLTHGLNMQPNDDL